MPSTLGIVASGWTTVLSLAPALWLDASDTATITAVGGAVSQWDDKSGNGRHVTQGVAAAQPITGSATLNGRNVIEFQSDYLTAASVTPWQFMHDGTTPWTVVYVGRPGLTANPNALYGICGTQGVTNANVGAYLSMDDRIGSSRNNAIFGAVSNGGAAVVTAVTNDTLTPNVVHLVRAQYDPGNATASARFSAWVDRGSLISGNAATGTPSTAAATYPLQIGAMGNNSSPLTGRIAELFIVPRALTTDEIAAVENYVLMKWGI